MSKRYIMTIIKKFKPSSEELEADNIKTMEEKTCKAHGTLLVLTKVGVSYGLPAFDKELFEAGSKLFPNSKRRVLGGCTAGAIGDSAEVLVCEDCRQAEYEWNESHRPYRNRSPGRFSDMRKELNLKKDVDSEK